MLKSIAEHREAVVSFISEDTLNLQESKARHYFTFNALYLKWFLLLGYVSRFFSNYNYNEIYILAKRSGVQEARGKTESY